jgi:regulation of enolase protein 1 (concanavalin A-like superfamily)
MLTAIKICVMRKNVFSAVFVLTCLLAVNCFAQKTLRFSKIPYPLTWENKPLSFSVSANSIQIEAGEKTDMFRDPNVTYNTDNAPKLFFTPDANFILTACIEHHFANKWDGGAIVLKADNLHWIKFCFEKDYTGQHRVVSVVTNNISDDCNSVAINGDKVFYKMCKADNVITLYFTQDGKKWFLVRHLQFNAKGPLHLGFMAQSPTGKNNKVTFSNITYANRKIKDPYAGE